MRSKFYDAFPPQQSLRRFMRVGVLGDHARGLNIPRIYPQNFFEAEQLASPIGFGGKGARHGKQMPFPPSGVTAKTSIAYYEQYSASD
jgi:hypothetical protein